MSSRILGASATKILVTDERGHGNANHEYSVFASNSGPQLASISFQNGPILEHGVNGIQNEDLLEIVIDRLVGFQAGEFHCDENEAALDYTRSALQALQARTVDRQARNVEGKDKK